MKSLIKIGTLEVMLGTMLAGIVTSNPRLHKCCNGNISNLLRKMKELPIFGRQSLDTTIEDGIKMKEEFLVLDVICECMLNYKTSQELKDYVLDWYNYYRDQALDNSLSKYQAIWKGIDSIKTEYISINNELEID